MANNSKSLNVPSARNAMDSFKTKAASEVGVNLQNGYNGDLTSCEAGSVGGQMVKNIFTVRPTKMYTFERKNRIVDGHKITVKYIAGIAV